MDSGQTATLGGFQGSKSDFPNPKSACTPNKPQTLATNEHTSEASDIAFHCHVQQVGGVPHLTHVTFSIWSDIDEDVDFESCVTLQLVFGTVLEKWHEMPVGCVTWAPDSGHVSHFWLATALI